MERLTRLMLLSVLYVSALCGIGCSTTKGPAPHHFDISKNVFDGQGLIFWVPSYGNGPDAWQLKTLSKGGDTDASRKLSQGLSNARNGETRVAAVGPNSKLTSCTIINALDLQKEQLPGLWLLFIGQPEDSEAVENAVKARGGRYDFSEDKPPE